MYKFILLSLFLGLLTTMFYLPVPMDKIEYTLEQRQLPFLKELTPNNQEELPVQNGFRALLNHSQEEKSTSNEYTIEKNIIFYQKNLAISTQSLNY